MSKILTPEQVQVIRSSQYLGENNELLTPVALLCDSHEALRTDRDSWQATAEELGDKNVNKALTARHEMREALLKKQVDELKAALNKKMRSGLGGLAGVGEEQ